VSPAEIRGLGSSGFKKLRVVSKEIDEVGALFFARMPSQSSTSA